MWSILSLLGIGAGLANDTRIYNQKYFGADKEIQRDNPRVVENRKRCQELYKKYSKEWK